MTMRHHPDSIRPYSVPSVGLPSRRTRLVGSLAAALALAALAVGCGDSSESGESGDSGDSGGNATSTTAAAGASGASGLSGTFRTDQLTVDGAARPLAPAGLTIEFEAGRIRANAGCNTMSGTATVSGDTIAVDDMASTEMGCEAAAQESDAIVAELLTGRPTFRLDGSTLTLSGKRTAATLQRADTAAGQVALTGTTWTLDTLISGATASSLPASERAAPTLRIDGTNLVLNACNAMTGTATVTEQHLSVGALAQTKMSCGADLDRLETTIAETLAQPLTVEIADGRLTLTAPDGSGLGFAAADGPQPDPAAR